MKFDMKTWTRVALMVVTAAALSCSNEISKSASPVELVVTNTQQLQRIDLQAGAANCDQNVGTIEIRAILKNPSGEVNQQFNDVRIKSYRVSYVRTDGGTHVPAPFVRSMDLLVPTGGSPSNLGTFIIVQADALTQAPFVSLLPTNGGRDAETGRASIGMDVIVQVFGETIAGSNVAGTTRFPLDFCYQCGGCS